MGWLDDFVLLLAWKHDFWSVSQLSSVWSMPWPDDSRSSFPLTVVGPVCYAAIPLPDFAAVFECPCICLLDALAGWFCSSFDSQSTSVCLLDAWPDVSRKHVCLWEKFSPNSFTCEVFLLLSNKTLSDGCPRFHGHLSLGSTQGMGMDHAWIQRTSGGSTADVPRYPMVCSFFKTKDYTPF